jgi:hypothetical protein
MRPLALLTAALGLALAGLALASQEGPGPAANPRISRVHKDLPLIEALVDSGLRLAAEDDPLQRAVACNALADRLAREVRRAAAVKDRSRASDLGHNLQDLLVRGVAGNLNLAFSTMTEESPQMAEARRVGEQAMQLTTPAMLDLERPSAQEAPDMREAAQALFRARAEVERAIKGKGSFQPSKRKRHDR